MRKALLVMAATAALSALAACNSNDGSGSSAPQAAYTPPPPQTKMPEPKPATESSAVNEGAYGMPHAPVPYDQLTAYEAEQGHAQNGRAAPGIYTEEQPTTPKNRREADSVFY